MELMEITESLKDIYPAGNLSDVIPTVNLSVSHHRARDVPPQVAVKSLKGLSVNFGPPVPPG